MRAVLSGCAAVTLGEQLSGACQAVQRWSAASAQLLERVCRRCLPVLRCVRNAAMQLAAGRLAGKLLVLRAAPESVALGNGTNNVSTPSVAHGAPERPAERL